MTPPSSSFIVLNWHFLTKNWLNEKGLQLNRLWAKLACTRMYKQTMMIGDIEATEEANPHWQTKWGAMPSVLPSITLHGNGLKIKHNLRKMLKFCIYSLLKVWTDSFMAPCMVFYANIFHVKRVLVVLNVKIFFLQSSTWRGTSKSVLFLSSIVASWAQSFKVNSSINLHHACFLNVLIGWSNCSTNPSALNKRSVILCVKFSLLVSFLVSSMNCLSIECHCVAK